MPSAPPMPTVDDDLQIWEAWRYDLVARKRNLETEIELLNAAIQHAAGDARRQGRGYDDPAILRLKEKKEPLVAQAVLLDSLLGRAAPKIEELRRARPLSETFMDVAREALDAATFGRILAEAKRRWEQHH